MPETRRKTPALSGYLAAMTRAVFEPGINWRVVDAKWPGIERAFRGFDPKTVAAFGPRDVERLMKDPEMIRNRRKIEATISNARELLRLDAERGGFRGWLESHPSSEETIADLHRHFKFLGEATGYHFLQDVGEPVPGHEYWMAMHPERWHGGPPRPPHPVYSR